MNMVTVVAALMLLGAAPQIEPCFGARTFESLVKTAWPWGAGTVKIDGRAEAWPREGSALRVETERRAERDGFSESYRFRNVSPQRISLGEIDINTPFNDDYRGLGKDGGAGSCHAHVWPGGSSAWVCAMRMNGKPPHLGLVVTEGAIAGYELKKPVGTVPKKPECFHLKIDDIRGYRCAECCQVVVRQKGWGRGYFRP